MKDGSVSTLVGMMLQALSKALLSEYVEFLISCGLCAALGKVVRNPSKIDQELYAFWRKRAA
jgi:hypothetical protein